MDLAAILVIGSSSEEPNTTTERSSASVGGEWVGVPYALLHVLGKPVLYRMIERLRDAGVQAISVVTDSDYMPSSALQREGRLREVNWIEAPATDYRQAVEEVYCDYAGLGFEDVLLMNLGPYAEFDVSDLLRFHRDTRQNATLVYKQDAPARIAIVNSRRRNDATFVLQSGLSKTRGPSTRYQFNGYLNPLARANDLRRLAQDGLLLHCDLRPGGKEMKPGIWVAEYAHIHRTARVLAPCFIGASSKVRAAAVITRATSLEHHSEVDCNTVVEDASILPYTYLGPGLDICHSVVGSRHIAHLVRNAQVEILDSHLVGSVVASASWRTVQNAASLASYLPRQFVRGLFAPSKSERPASLPSSVDSLSPAVKSSELARSTAASHSEVEVLRGVRSREEIWGSVGPLS
jgi:NDP-sugar pyrophosphorylase family protein